MPERDVLDLTVVADPASMERARLRILERFGASPGLADNPRNRYALELVLEEWLTNVFRHAAGSRVQLNVAVDASAVTLRFIDDGPPFDPTEHPRSELPARLDEARPGGLGLFLIQYYASHWRYEREDGRNVMQMEIDLVAR